MLTRRILIVIAVLMGLTALAAGVAPRQPAPTGGDDGLRSVPAPSPAKPVVRTIEADASEPARIVLRSGQTLELEVKATETDSVSLEGLGKIEPVEPESPARFEVLAELPGTYPVRLLDADRDVGTLEIRD